MPTEWREAMLQEIVAARAAGRQLSRDDLLELFLRHAPGPFGGPTPSSGEMKASLAPYEKDLQRIAAEVASTLPDGMANPAFIGEFGKRAKAFMTEQMGRSDGASA